MKYILYILCLLPTLCFADPITTYSIIPQDKDRLFKFSLDNEFQNIYGRLSISVDNYSNQTINGTKTFNTQIVANGGITVSSVTVSGEITSGYGFYHDRGVASGYDFTKTSLTTNSDWHVLDLSSIVPSGAKAVDLHIIYDGGAGTEGWSVSVRKNRGGTSDFYNIKTGYEIVGGRTHSLEATVGVDSDRKIEYYATNGVWVTISMVVCGWWK